MGGRHIFTYGSLMFTEVWQNIVRRVYHRETAWLDGFRRTCIYNDSYPVVLPRAGEKDLEGVVYFAVDELDLRRLDEFEGDYYYRRRVFPRILKGGVAQKIRAEIYLLKPRYAHLASPRPWSPDFFAERKLKQFRRVYRPG